jgi:hypothetical protein
MGGVTMGGSMYLVQGKELIEMTERPYGLESHLQQWIAEHPALLAGDQMNPENPRRLVLIGRELAIPSELDGSGRWPIDHLFIDQDAVPTIVEAKRSSNPEIRRQVVGQMIDYAANAVRYLPISLIRNRFQVTCSENKADPSEKLSDLLGPDIDDGRIEQFWELVESNLQTGRIRLIFVGDIIPPELRRAVEYLNDQMEDAEVLAVEIKQFKGESVTTLVPRLIGQTERARQRKTVSGNAEPKIRWNEPRFMAAISALRDSGEVETMKHIYNRTVSIGTPYWGEGKAEDRGSYYPELHHNGMKHYIFALRTSGDIELQFQWMLGKVPFDDVSLRRELADRLLTIPGMCLLPDEVLTKRPHFPVAALPDDTTLQEFFRTVDWYFDTIRAH